jgi:tRNA nucleotidyltransferase/poly(A) polymerase
MQKDDIILSLPKNIMGFVETIKTLSKENGFDCYIVGGAVRDLILNGAPKDLDILVCDKQNRAEIGKNSGIIMAKLLSEKYAGSSLVVFERFGTARFIYDGFEIEFVMPRKEYYTDDSRNPDTELGDIAQDALRRDFTVNALFLKISDGSLLDLTSLGLKDIKRRLLQTTDPAKAEFIFNQDPLRTLRAIRFSGQLGFAIDPFTFSAIKKTAKRISIVSPERIRDELIKILLQTKPSHPFLLLWESLLLGEILPEIQRLKNSNESHFCQMLKALDDIEPDLVLRLSAMSVFLEPHLAKQLLHRLKFPKLIIIRTLKIIEHCKILLEKINAAGKMTDAQIRMFAYSSGEMLFDILKTAESFIKAKGISQEKFNQIKNRVFALESDGKLFFNANIIDGNIIMQTFNLPQGKWLKDAKDFIIDTLAHNPDISKDEILLEVGKFLKASIKNPSSK